MSTQPSPQNWQPRDPEHSLELARLEQETARIKEKLTRGRDPAHGQAQDVPAILIPTFKVLSEADMQAHIAQQDAEIHAEQAKERREGRQAKWEAICPTRFRESFDFAQVDPEASLEGLRAILAWTYQRRGLYLVGDSGHSKTRAVFSMLTRLFVEECRSVKWLDGHGFANAAAAAYKDPESTERWLKTLFVPDVLFLDDLAKRWTPTTEEAAFCVIDRRGAWNKPTIITINYAAEQLREKAHDALVIEPFLRRVRQYLEPLAV